VVVRAVVMVIVIVGDGGLAGIRVEVFHLIRVANSMVEYSVFMCDSIILHIFMN
jgi:hypothetical protein